MHSVCCLHPEGHLILYILPTTNISFKFELGDEMNFKNESLWKLLFLLGDEMELELPIWIVEGTNDERKVDTEGT